MQQLSGIYNAAVKVLHLSRLFVTVMLWPCSHADLILVVTHFELHANPFHDVQCNLQYVTMS